MKIVINGGLDAYCNNKCEECPIRFVCYTKKVVREIILNQEQTEYLLHHHKQWLTDALSGRRRYQVTGDALREVATSRRKIIKEFMRHNG